jgi:Tfp pilus assembly protein PilF
MIFALLMALLFADAARLAEDAWKRGDYQAANDYFRSAVAQQPKSAALKVRWGRLYLDRFQPADAEALFTEALEIDPKNAEAVLGLALVASSR